MLIGGCCSVASPNPLMKLKEEHNMITGTALVNLLGNSVSDVEIVIRVTSQ